MKKSEMKQSELKKSEQKKSGMKKSEMKKSESATGPRTSSSHEQSTEKNRSVISSSPNVLTTSHFHVRHLFTMTNEVDQPYHVAHPEKKRKSKVCNNLPI